MRAFPKTIAIAKVIAIAAVSVSTATFANPAAAQTFDERWSVIPKAHADPAPATPDQAKEDPKGQPSNAVNIPDSSGDKPAKQTASRTFSGKASFYSYQTGKTASGAAFNRELPTAAHRSLPFGTKVRVTDLATDKSIVVRINDRGPNIRGRVLDLSRGAARSLGIMDRGIVEVRAEVL
ncbi:septal ring lytic transglycosylase RlpA family protein [Bradyrhizobium septentrionale]|uniref:Endolytic peptidoglycan transglycosylase RlpA n=1 Tax=Bradyrhizobium septentrionale TaxID=1404411 RepID=A0ABZ2P3E1_9BRAD